MRDHLNANVKGTFLKVVLKERQCFIRTVFDSEFHCCDNSLSFFLCKNVHIYIPFNVFQFLMVPQECFLEQCEVILAMMLCAEESVLCAEESVLCAEESVLCDEGSVLCNEESVLCDEESVLCDEESVLCDEECIMC